MAQWTPAGELRNRVEVQREVPAEDSMGTPTKPTWQTFATRSAKIEGLSGAQALLAQQAQSTSTYLIKIRYTPNISPLNRILFRGRVFSIVGTINVEERNRELWLNCREVVVGQGG